jgi:hypothetical protein
MPLKFYEGSDGRNMVMPCNQNIEILKYLKSA